MLEPSFGEYKKVLHFSQVPIEEGQIPGSKPQRSIYVVFFLLEASFVYFEVAFS